MALSGKYELVKSEGQLEHMLAVGLPEERAKKIGEQKTLEILIDGDKVILNRGDGHTPPPVLIGQETEEKGPNGRILKNKAALNGGVLVLETSTDEGKWTREYTLAGSELTVVSSHSKPGVPNGKRVYKKL